MSERVELSEDDIEMIEDFASFLGDILDDWYAQRQENREMARND
jgi:predicted flap endonuclease-1-like 5' DNA nuclease